MFVNCLCSRIPVATAVAAQATNASSVAVGREVVKAQIVVAPRKPETVSVNQILRGNLQKLVPPTERPIPWDEVFAPQTSDSGLDVQKAEPVFVEPPSDDRIETRYEIKGELGRGSYGTVYTGTEINTGREVAVKEIRRVDGCSVLSECKLQQEIDVLEDLRECSAVVKIQGSYQTEEQTYIVTELCKGGDLENFLKTNGPLGERQMAMVAYQALRMLWECHSKKIVHGDVKAANFVLDNAVDYHMFNKGASPMPDGWLKAIDFGTSQYTGRGRCSNKVGTPTHWAPEVFAESYHTEADLWSLGVMLYRLMTGRLPFWTVHEEAQLKSERDVLRGVIHSTPDFDSEHWTRLSPECVDFVRALLDPNYATRLSAESALMHPFMMKHFNKQQRLGLGMFEKVVLPSTAMDTFPSPV